MMCVRDKRHSERRVTEKRMRNIEMAEGGREKCTYIPRFHWGEERHCEDIRTHRGAFASSWSLI